MLRWFSFFGHSNCLPLPTLLKKFTGSDEDQNPQKEQSERCNPWLFEESIRFGSAHGTTESQQI